MTVVKSNMWLMLWKNGLAIYMVAELTITE